MRARTRRRARRRRSARPPSSSTRRAGAARSRSGSSLVGDEVRQPGEHGRAEERVADPGHARRGRRSPSAELANGSATKTREPAEVGADHQPLAREPVDERARAAGRGRRPAGCSRSAARRPTSPSACGRRRRPAARSTASQLPIPERERREEEKPEAAVLEQAGLAGGRARARPRNTYPRLAVVRQRAVAHRVTTLRVGHMKAWRTYDARWAHARRSELEACGRTGSRAAAVRRASATTAARGDHAVAVGGRTGLDRPWRRDPRRHGSRQHARGSSCEARGRLTRARALRPARARGRGRRARNACSSGVPTETRMACRRAEAVQRADDHALAQQPS